MKERIKEAYFSNRLSYEFPNEDSAKQAYKIANKICEDNFFMEGIVELDVTIVKVPTWFPFVPKYGKQVRVNS